MSRRTGLRSRTGLGSGQLADQNEEHGINSTPRMVAMSIPANTVMPMNLARLGAGALARTSGVTPE